MAIDIEWQDEDGNVLARCDGPALTRAAVESAAATTVCARFIDPYGDTVVNQQQTPLLVSELEALAVPDPMLRFLRLWVGEPHTYLKVIGD